MLPPTKIEYSFKVIRDGQKPFPMRFEGDLINREIMTQKYEVEVPAAQILENLGQRKEIIGDDFYREVKVHPRPKPKMPNMRE